MKIFKKQFRNAENLLLRSFDALLKSDEKNYLTQALDQSAELRASQKSISTIRAAISQSRVDSFNPFFADRVMQQIYAISRATEDFFTSLLWSFRRIAIPGFACLVLLMTHNFVRTEKISVETFLSLPQLTLEETWSMDDLAEGEFE